MPSLRKCGIYIVTVKPYISASPDGSFTYRCHDPVLIEVKCLWSMKEKSVEEYVHTGKGKTCIKPDHTINRIHEFYTQIQLQPYVTGFREAHLVLWSPKEIIITLVNRDNVFIVSMVEKLDAFFQHVIKNSSPEGWKQISQCSITNQIGYLPNSQAWMTCCRYVYVGRPTLKPWCVVINGIIILVLG